MQDQQSKSLDSDSIIGDAKLPDILNGESPGHKKEGGKEGTEKIKKRKSRWDQPPEGWDHSFGLEVADNPTNKIEDIAKQVGDVKSPGDAPNTSEKKRKFGRMIISDDGNRSKRKNRRRGWDQRQEVWDQSSPMNPYFPGPYGNMDGQDGNMDGLYGKMDEPYGNMDRPYGNMDGPYGNMDGPYAKMDKPYGNMDRPYDNMDRPYGNVDGAYSNMDGPYSNMDGPYGNMDGPYGNMDGPYSKMDGPYSNMDGPYGNKEQAHQALVQALAAGITAAINSGAQTSGWN